MTASDPAAKALAALLKRLTLDFPPPVDAAETAKPPTIAIDPAEPVLAELVWSFLLWEATTPKAAAATKRLGASMVDFNELRVCLPDELCRLLGERYPKASERAQRLRAALNEIVEREHGMSLERLTTQGKREARAYLDSLEGVPPFVSARVVAHALGGHAVPVDGRLLIRLLDAGLVPTGTDIAAASGCLERRIRAGETLEACRLLQAWSDHEPAAPADNGHREVGGNAGKKGSRPHPGKGGKAGHRS